MAVDVVVDEIGVIICSAKEAKRVWGGRGGWRMVALCLALSNGGYS